jgi:hypothetical protein
MSSLNSKKEKDKKTNNGYTPYTGAAARYTHVNGKILQ